MRLEEALSICDRMGPNAFRDEDKIRWLSELDGRVTREIGDVHEGSWTFEGYDEDTPPCTVLIVPEPYSEIYPLYLAAKIDFMNAEFARYNNSVALFNAAYEDYAAYYKRTHSPKRGARITL